MRKLNTLHADALTQSPALYVQINQALIHGHSLL